MSGYVKMGSHGTVHTSVLLDPVTKEGETVIAMSTEDQHNLVVQSGDGQAVVLVRVTGSFVNGVQMSASEQSIVVYLQPHEELRIVTRKKT